MLRFTLEGLATAIELWRVQIGSKLMMAYIIDAHAFECSPPLLSIMLAVACLSSPNTWGVLRQKEDDDSNVLYSCQPAFCDVETASRPCVVVGLSWNSPGFHQAR